MRLPESVSNLRDEYRITVFGCGGVGKSALTIRFIIDDFLEEYDPTIEDSYRKELVVDDKSLLLDVLDTAGPEEYCSLHDHSTRESDGFIFCIAPDVVDALDSVRYHYKRALIIKDVANNTDLAMCIAANKCDLEYSPNLLAEAQDLASDWGCEFIMNSAKDSINTNYVFEHLVREMRKPLGERGTWPWNVGGREKHHDLLFSIDDALQNLQFPPVLIDEFLSFILSAHFVNIAREYKPTKKRRNCSIM